LELYIHTDLIIHEKKKGGRGGGRGERERESKPQNIVTHDRMTIE
jgi:hypothetical protein